MISHETILTALRKCTFEDLYEYNVHEEVLDLMDHGILPLDRYETGATKLVLIPSNEDFVIKIPFKGCPNQDYDPDETEDDYAMMPIWTFENADEPDGWDYCRAEAIRYERAVEAGIQMLFAKTELIGYANDYPIYIQPKCKVFANMNTWDSYSDEQCQSTRDKCKKLGVDCFNTAWLFEFLNYFKPEMLVKLNEWIYAHAMWDLHDGNLGFTLDTNQPILIDYSDFAD